MGVGTGDCVRWGKEDGSPLDESVVCSWKKRKTTYERREEYYTTRVRSYKSCVRRRAKEKRNEAGALPKFPNYFLFIRSTVQGPSLPIRRYPTWRPLRHRSRHPPFTSSKSTHWNRTHRLCQRFTRIPTSPHPRMSYLLSTFVSCWIPKWICV